MQKTSSRGLANPVKEPMRGLAGRATELIERTALDLRDGLRDFPHVSRLTTLTAIWHRCEERAVRLQHELAERRRGHGVADVLAVLEGDDAGEADHRAGGTDAGESRRVAGETVEYAARPPGERLHERERVVERVAALMLSLVRW